jgi:hypothetical protein
MGKRFLFFGFLLFGAVSALSLGGRAQAQEYNHVITVYATVAEQRAVYVDASGSIYKVAGNTTRNITPQVFTADNKLIDMTDGIMRQYQSFLDSHGGNLAAGKIYNVNPIVVNTAPNLVTIRL